jgi:hypothetical protein
MVNRCRWCNKEIKERKTGKGRQRLFYCSDECRENFFNSRKLNFDDYMPGKDFGTQVCLNCGKVFKKTHQRRIYCCRDCAEEMTDKKVDEYNQKMKFQCRGSYLGTSMTHFRGSTYVFSSDDDKKKLVATFTPDDGVYNVNISDLPDDF